MRLPWQNPYAPALAFATLALFGGWGLKASADHAADRLHQSQLATCERQNELRRESNNRIPAHIADTTVLRDFLLGASEARTAAWTRDHSQVDLEAARTYRLLVGKLDATVHFTPVDIVNCEKVIPKP